MNLIAEQISSSLVYSGDSTLVIDDFSNLNGDVSELGRLIGEELVTRLFRKNKFLIVDRKLSKNINTNGYLPNSDKRKLNKSKTAENGAPIQAFVTGTLSEVDNSIIINARIISTETRLIIAVANGEIYKDQQILSLYNKQIELSNNDKPAIKIKKRAEIDASYTTIKKENWFSLKELGTDWIIREKAGIRVTFDKYRAVIWSGHTKDNRHKAIDKTYLLEQPLTIAPYGQKRVYLAEKSEIIDKATFWGYEYQVWLFGNDENGNKIIITN